MLKKRTVMVILLLMAVLILGPLASAAPDDFFDSNKPVSCGPFREIVSLLAGTPFQEQPVWIAPSGNDATNYVLFRNPKTQTWTLVQYGKEIGCVLGMGSTDTAFFDSGRK